MFIVSQVSLVLPVCRQWSFIFVTHWWYSLPRPSSLYLSLSISRSLLCVSNYDSPCGISFSHTNTKLCLPGSHFSLLFPCVPLAHPSYRDVFCALDRRTYDSSSSISLSHTQTQTMSPRVSYFSIVLLYVAHTHPLSLEISCVPSYVSLAITLVVKYLSLSQTQNSVSLDLISLWYLFVCDSHAPSLYLSHTHTHNPAFWSTRLLSLTHTS